VPKKYEPTTETIETYLGSSLTAMGSKGIVSPVELVTYWTGQAVLDIMRQLAKLEGKTDGKGN